jgi:hypothetical protein
MALLARRLSVSFTLRRVVGKRGKYGGSAGGARDHGYLKSTSTRLWCRFSLHCFASSTGHIPIYHTIANLGTTILS